MQGSGPAGRADLAPGIHRRGPAPRWCPVSRGSVLSSPRRQGSTRALITPFLSNYFVPSAARGFVDTVGNQRQPLPCSGSDGHRRPVPTESALYWVPQGAVLRVAWYCSVPCRALTSLPAPYNDAHGWRTPLPQHLLLVFFLALLPPHRCSVTDAPPGSSAVALPLYLPAILSPEGCGEVCWRR